MRNIIVPCIVLLCCLLCCGCIDRTGREASEATEVVPDPSPPPPAETLVVNLPIGTVGPTPVDTIAYPGTTGGTSPFPLLMNEGNPLVLVINAATVRPGDAAREAPGIAECKLLVLNVTVRNVKADPYDFTQSSIRIVDSENRQVRPFAGRIPGEQELGDGRIAQDRSRSGTIAFEVPARADRHYLIAIYDNRRHESLWISLFQATEEA